MNNEKNKFSYRNSPVLKKIEQKTLGLIGVTQVDVEDLKSFGSDFEDEWVQNVSYFGEKIWHISKTFYEALNLARPKLKNSEVIEKTETQSGTILINNITHCFRIINENNRIKVKLMSFLDNRIIMSGECVIFERISGMDRKTETTHWVSNSIESEENKNLFFRAELADIFLILNFIKYAEIQTKYLPPNSKIKEDVVKYVNDTKCKITLLNSTWFTNLVKSDGFKVRGHLRFQPYGTGRLQKKIIWVEEFEKTGYTAPARKLSSEISEELPK